jgi:hypothetical protein
MVEVWEGRRQGKERGWRCVGWSIQSGGLRCPPGGLIGLPNLYGVMSSWLRPGTIRCCIMTLGGWIGCVWCICEALGRG